MAALRSGFDVEILMEGHIACVRAVEHMGGPRYAIQISHDTKQGEVGGTVKELVILNTETGLIAGAGSSTQFYMFVIELPLF